MNRAIAVLFAGICFQACNFRTEKSASPTLGGAFFSSEVDLESYYSGTFPDSGVLVLNENREFLGVDSIPCSAWSKIFYSTILEKNLIFRIIETIKFNL